MNNQTETPLKNNPRRLSSLWLTAAALLLAVCSSPAASITWTNVATAVWTNAIAWNPNGLLASANDYDVSGATATMQSVDAATSTFTGSSVTVRNGATVYLFRTNGGTGITVNDIFTNTVAVAPITLSLSNATISVATSLGTVTHRIKTPVNLKGTNTISFSNNGTYALALYFDSTVTGSGFVSLARGATGTSKQRDFYLAGDCSGYSGSWTNTGVGTGTAGILSFYTTHVSGWGSGNVTINAYANLNVNAGITNPASRVNLAAATATMTVNNAATIGSLVGVASSTATLNNSLTLADNTSTTFSGNLTGTGALNKNGSGTLTLPAVNLSGGLTTVNAGTLIANGSVGGLTMNNGTTLVPGTAALTAGSLSVGGNLTLNTNTVNLDISSSTGSGNDSIAVSGNLALNGIIKVNLNLLNGTTSAGPYAIMTYGGTLTGGTTNFQIIGSHAATIDLTTPNQVNLWFTNGTPVNLVWIGDGTNNFWDAGTSYTWFNGANPDFFGQGDHVTFDDTATNLTANVVGTLSPGTFVVTNSTNNFVIQGGGSISGGVTLLKAGTASLTVSNANAFSGGTTISAGSIVAKSTNAPLGTGTVTLGDANTGTNAAGLYISYKETFTNAIVVSASGTGTATVGSDQSGGASGSSTTYSSPITLNRSLTLDSGNQLDRLHFGGAITGTGNLTLLGGHRIDLGGVNSFNGNLYIQGAGTLFETFGPSCIPTTATVDVGTGSTFGLFYSATVTALTGGGLVEPYGGTCTLTVGANDGSGGFSGTLTNNGAYVLSLVKTGNGTQTINGADYRSANTTVSGGTLAIGAAGSISNSPTITVAGGATFDVSAQSGAFTLNGGQTLAGSGSVAGGFNTSSNATIAPNGSAPGTLTFNNNLTLTGNSILSLNLTNDTTVGSGINDLISVGGNLTLNGTNTIVLSAISQQSLVPGTYRLINYTGSLTGDATNLVVAPVLTRLTMTPDTSTANQVNLIVSGSSSNLVWNGGLNGNVWDVNTTSNWLDGAVTDFFYQQDGVTFNDVGGANSNVSLATTLYPASLVVNSSSNYIFGGSGNINGATGLAKSGTGSLTISNANTYTGGTTISAGMLQLDAATAAGSGTIALGNNTLGVNIGNATLANAITGTGTINVTETTNANTAFGGDLSGFTGTINCPVSAGGTAKTVISSGSVNLNSAATINIASGGTFYTSVSIPSAIQVAGAGNTENLGALRMDGAITLSGPVTLQGNAAIGNNSSGANITGVISDGGNNYALSKIGGYTLSLSGTNAYTGGLTVTGGTVNLAGDQSAATGSIALSPAGAANTATVTVQAGTPVVVAATNHIQVGPFASSGTASQTFNVNGTVTNNGSLLVARVGYLNINSGGLWIQNGSLTNSPPSGSGYSAYVNVNAGGTLIYNGTNTIKVDSSIGNSGYGQFVIAGNVLTSQGFERTVNASTAIPFVQLNGGVITLTTNIAALMSSPLVTTGGVLSVQMAAGGGVIDTAGFSTTISNVISSTGSFTKMGAGTLSLPFTNTYTGATVVSNGTLLVNGKLAPGSTVSVYATLKGVGNIGGPTTIEAGGLVQPGNGTLTISNLTLGASSSDVCTNAFNIGAGAKIFTTTLNVTGTNIVNILDSTLTVGTNDLIYYSGAIGGNGLGGFVLGPLPPNTTGYLTNSPTAVQLVVTSAGVPPAVTVTPASTNVFALSTVVFTANVTSGTAPFTYQWYDNHTNVLAGATNSALTLTNLAVIQSGNYTVMVTNAVGNASAYGSLTVNALVAPVVSGNASLGGGGFQLTFSGPAGETFQVIASINLTAAITNWTVLTNGTFGAGTVTFSDVTATNHPQQYYRITAP